MRKRDYAHRLSAMSGTDQPEPAAPHTDEADHAGQAGVGGLAGQAVALDDDAARAAVADRAFDFRGDVTLELADGRTMDAYVYDRRLQSEPAVLRLMLPPQGDAQRGEKIDVALNEIKKLTFSPKDPAAGKSWEAWLRRYVEKKARGESADL